MKTKMLIILVLPILTVSNCSKPRFQSTGNKDNSNEFITINTEQAERFNDVMNYLEKKSPDGFKSINLSKKVDKGLFESNFNDKILANKIDSLISLPIYNKFGRISTSWVDNKKYSGRESYRMAFMHLPFECINMTASMPETWIRFWRNDITKNIKPLLTYISSNKEEFLRKVIDKTAIYLPKGVNLQSKTYLYLCFDGNRGSFQWDDKIVMDLIHFTKFDTTAFTNTLCHELHHRFYGDWLTKNTPIKGKTSTQRILRILQTAIIEEGIAQQFNFSDKNEQSKALYSNRQLIEELYNKLVTAIRELETQKNPNKWFRAQMDSEFNYAMALLKKYSPNGYDTETISNRPTVIYYLSYHLYNSIYRAGGYSKLKYVIENPKELLAEYNKIYSEELLVPKLPDDIIRLWISNFNN